MEFHLKKNEACELVFPMVSSATPATFVTGETVTDTAYYYNGTWNTLAISDAVTEIGTTGMYQLSMLQAEMNYDLIFIKLTSTNSADSVIIIRTYAVDVDDLVRSTTPANTLDVTATGAAGIDWGNVENQGTSVDLSATAMNLVDTATSVGSVSGAVGSVTGNVGGNVVGSVGSISGVTFPTNFGDLAITVTTGYVTAGTVSDKTGYSISGTITTLDGLNNFDPTTDTVANVTTVGSVTATVSSDVVSISGTAGAADNLELLFDGNEGFYSAYDGPRGPGVYLNDSGANTNTSPGVDGTTGNPVSTIAAAKTIADSMSLDRIYLVNDSAPTLGAAMPNYEFVGLGDISANSITLGSQNVTNSTFVNLLVTGAQGGTGRIELRDCSISSLTGAGIIARNCAVENNITFARDSFLHQCFSAIAGSGSPQFNCNSVADLDLSFRDYSGGATFTNAVSTTSVSLEGNGQFVVDASCTSINLSVRGNFKETDNGTTSSITRDALMNRSALDSALTSYDAPTNTEMTAAFTEIKGATWASGTDTLEHIRDKLTDVETDTAEIGAAGAGLTALPWNASWDAEVQSEVTDALDATYAEFPQSAPSFPASISSMIRWNYKLSVAKSVQDSSTGDVEVYNSNGTTVDHKKTVTNASGVYTDPAWSSGP